MKVVRIFDGYNSLMSFKYDNEEKDEFNRIFDLWSDAEYLFNFFDNNSGFFSANYWKNREPEEIAMETISKAEKFEECILCIDLTDESEIFRFLENIFKPLDSSTYSEKEIEKSKARYSWLRLYALKVNKSAFIITGGAIKLTETMQGHEDTAGELRKLEKCRYFLKEQGISDIEQLETLL